MGSELFDHPARGLPALLHPGRMDAFWVVSGGLAFSDGNRLWMPTSTGWTLAPTGTRIGADGIPIDGGRPRTPLGAATARLFGRDARGCVWAQHGFVYRAGSDGVRCIGVGEPNHLEVGPRGACVWGSTVLDVGAGPGSSGRPIRELAVDAWGVRFSVDGRRVYGHDPDTGDAVAVDLDTGLSVGTWPDWNWADGGTHALHGGRLGGWRGLCEASWARNGPLLAGPGGAVWDLSTGLRRGTPGFGLGITAALEDGWMYLHWDTGVGFTSDLTGGTVRPIAVDLPEQDVLAGVESNGTDVWVVSAEGRRWRVATGSIVDAEPPAPAVVAGFEVDAVYRGTHWVAGWNESGLLVVGDDVTERPVSRAAPRRSGTSCR